MLTNKLILPMILGTLAASAMDHNDPNVLRQRLLASVTGDLAWPATQDQSRQSYGEGSRYISEEARFKLRNDLGFPINLFYTSQPVMIDVSRYYTITGTDQIQPGQTTELNSRVNYTKMQPEQSVKLLGAPSEIECYFYIGHMLLELQHATTHELLTRKIIEACGKWLISHKEGQVTIEQDTQAIEQAEQQRLQQARQAAGILSIPSTQKSTLQILFERCGCTIQ